MSAAPHRRSPQPGSLRWVRRRTLSLWTGGWQALRRRPAGSPLAPAAVAAPSTSVVAAALWRRRRWRPSPPALLLFALLPALPPVLAIPPERRPAPPPAPVEHYDPDPSICRPQAIRNAFQKQLQPWSEQPQAVLAQLRQLQAEMTLATLRRCVRRGLMKEAEALAVARQLQLLAPAAPSPVQAVPASAGAGTSVPSTAAQPDSTPVPSPQTRPTAPSERP